MGLQETNALPGKRLLEIIFRGPATPYPKAEGLLIEVQKLLSKRFETLDEIKAAVEEIKALAQSSINVLKESANLSEEGEVILTGIERVLNIQYDIQNESTVVPSSLSLIVFNRLIRLLILEEAGNDPAKIEVANKLGDLANRCSPVAPDTQRETLQLPLQSRRLINTLKDVIKLVIKLRDKTEMILKQSPATKTLNRITELLQVASGDTLPIEDAETISDSLYALFNYAVNVILNNNHLDAQFLGEVRRYAAEINENKANKSNCIGDLKFMNRFQRIFALLIVDQVKDCSNPQLDLHNLTEKLFYEHIPRRDEFIQDLPQDIKDIYYGFQTQIGILSKLKVKI